MSGLPGALIRFLITAMLLAAVLTQTNPSELLEQFGGQLLPAAAGGLGLVFIALLFNAARWALITRGMSAPLSMIKSIEIVLVGHFFSQMLPTSIGGDAFRIWGARQVGLGTREAVSSILFDRLSGLTVLVILIGAGLPFLAHRTENSLPIAFAAALLLCYAVGIAVLFNLHRLTSVFKYTSLWKPFVDLSQSANAVMKHPHVVAGIIASSIGVHLSAVCLTWYIARSMGVQLSFVDALTIIPAVTFLSNLPISLGGWGVREAGLAGGFFLLGLPVGAAVSISILIGLLNLIASLPGGGIFLFWRHKGGVNPAASAS